MSIVTGWLACLSMRSFDTSKRQRMGNLNILTARTANKQYIKKAKGGFSGGCFCALLLVRSPDEHFGKSPFKKTSVLRKKFCKGREAGQLVFIPLLFSTAGALVVIAV